MLVLRSVPPCCDVLGFSQQISRGVTNINEAISFYSLRAFQVFEIDSYGIWRPINTKFLVQWKAKFLHSYCVHLFVCVCSIWPVNQRNPTPALLWIKICNTFNFNICDNSITHGQAELAVIRIVMVFWWYCRNWWWWWRSKCCRDQSYVYEDPPATLN